MVKWGDLHGRSSRAVQRQETLKSLQISPLDLGFFCFPLKVCCSANKKQHNPIAANPLGLSEETNASLHIIRQLGVQRLFGTQDLHDASSTYKVQIKMVLSSSDPLGWAFLHRCVPTVPCWVMTKSPACFARAASLDLQGEMVCLILTLKLAFAERMFFIGTV